MQRTLKNPFFRVFYFIRLDDFSGNSEAAPTLNTQASASSANTRNPIAIGNIDVLTKLFIINAIGTENPLLKHPIIAAPKPAI
jgi:hypothetical protein